MIDVRVGDENLREPSPCQRLAQRVEVTRFADPGIDQRRDASRNQPCPVAVARDRPRVEREDWNGFQKNTFSRA